MESTINYKISINIPENPDTVVISKEAGNKSNIVIVKAKQYKLALKSFHYHKKMYEPLEIKASVQVSRNNSYDGIEISDLSAIREKLLGSKISIVYADNNTIAENCFVYAASYTIKKGSETTPSFELTICSPDKKLDLDKFNEAYTGKQFFEEITKSLCLKVGMTVTDLSFEPTFGQYSVADSKDNKPKEYRTPYLVQYDETPLTFLSRTANRNGEFLYFEGGKYNVGLKSTAEKDIKNYNDIPNFYSLSDKKMNVSGLKTGFHTYNYTKDNLNFTADNDDTIYYRSFELLNDEDFTSLKEQKDLFKDVADGAMYFVNNFFFAGSMKWKKDAEGNYAESFVPKKLVKIFSKVLNNSKSLSELGLKYLTENLTSYFSSLASLSNDRSANNANVEGYKNIVADNTGKDDDLACVYQFTNFPVSHATYKHKKIDVSFRQMILENEESLLDKVLQLEYKGHPDVTLGKLLKIGTTKYIVIEIEPCVLQVTEDKDTVNDVEGLRVLVIPYSVLSIKEGDATKEEPCPLPLPYEKGLVRKAEMQHAIVTQNDDPEGLGRVRVAYLWQHGKLTADELSNSDNESDTKKLNATPWIRIVTPMANEEGGHYFKPDVGDEVMVDYEYGNVERPYVMGEVFSKNRKIGSDYNITSPNGHSITFNNPDSPTTEWLSSTLPGLGNLAKFWPQLQGAMGTWGGDRRVGGGIELSDALGFYNISMSTSDRSISISSPLGNIEMSAFTGISIEAPNGDISIKGKNIEIEAGNSITVTSGTNIKKNGKKRGGLIPLDKKGELDGVALLSSVTNTLLKPFVDLTKVVDLNLIRTIIEVFVRPVNGTLLLKSNRYLELEAGKGVTEVPTVDYDSTSKYGKRVLTTSNKDKAKVTKIKDLFKFFALLANEAYDFINVNHNALLGEADDGNDYQKFCAEYTKYKLLIRTSNNFTAFKTKVYTLKTVEELIGTIYSKIEGKTDYDLTNENNKLKLADFAKDIKISDVNDLDSEEPNPLYAPYTYSSLEEFENYNILVGTAHEFQGNERDRIYVSWCVNKNTAIQSFTFINNENLFNVAVTRAKNNIIHYVSMSSADMPNGLLREYLETYKIGETCEANSLPYVNMDLVNFYEVFKETMCNGIGQRSIKLFLGKQIKSEDKIAELYKFALEAENFNINAKKYRNTTAFSYKDDCYMKKEETIIKLTELCKQFNETHENKIKYGKQYTDNYSTNYIIFFDLPSDEKEVEKMRLSDEEVEE